MIRHQSNMIKSFLLEQGLTENEANIYLASYKLGSAPVSIIAKHAQLNRTTAYGNVKILLRRGLLTKHIKSDVEYFSAVEPKFFEQYLEDRKHKIIKSQQQLSEIIPLFEQMRSPYVIKPQVRFYEGIDGIKQIHQLMIDTDHPIYSFLPFDLVPKKLMKYVKSEFMKKKKKKAIFSFVIAPESEETRILQKRDHKENRTTYLIPRDRFPFASEVTVFGDNVALIAFESPDLIGILIHSPSIASTLRLIFELSKENAASQKV